MNRIASLEAERASAKLLYEAAWRCGDADAEMRAALELERIGAEIKRELYRIEHEDD